MLIISRPVYKIKQHQQQNNQILTMFVVRFPEPYHGTKPNKDIQPSSFVNDGSEEKDAFTLSFDVPGVKKENVSIDEHDGVLEVLAVRKSGDNVIARLEKKYKLNARMLDLSGIRVELEDGVLNIVVPKNKDANTEPASVVVTPGQPEPEQMIEDSNDENKEFRYSSDLPGVRLEDLEIKIVDDFGTDTAHLMIHATRQRGQYVSEIRRQFTIPAVSFDTKKVQAFLADGVLTVVAPPRVKATPVGIRKIPIGSDEVIVETVKEAEE